MSAREREREKAKEKTPYQGDIFSDEVLVHGTVLGRSDQTNPDIQWCLYSLGFYLGKTFITQTSVCNAWLKDITSGLLNKIFQDFF